MTFPVVQIFCPECEEPMTLVNKPEISNCIAYFDSYDKQVDYHYRCDSNERHIGKWHDDEGNIVKLSESEAKITTFSKCSNWCDISNDKEIVVMRILIPNLDLDEPYSSPTTATVNMINIEKQMRDDGFMKFNKSEPATNLLLNIPTDKEIKESVIDQELKDKTIQWIKLEKEVLDIMNGKTDSGEITYEEWTKFFVSTIKEYGNEEMLKQLTMFVNYLKYVKLPLPDSNDNIDELYKILNDNI